MDADSFHDLALRVVARKADAEDVARLEAELAGTPARRQEYSDLQATCTIIASTLPLSDAMNATGPEFPAHRQNELRTAVRQHFGPAAARTRPVFHPGAAIRWLLGGAGFAVVWVAVILICFANRTVEIGLYQTDLVRGDNQPLTARDVPSARLVTFEQDAPFDQWQSQPLAWNQHAKIWVDNERDLLHVVRRQRHGQISIQTEPLAPTAEGQREQIERVVQSLQN